MRSSFYFDRAAALLSALLLVAPHPLAPAVIVVDGACSLADAVTAANTDAAAGGCTAGAGPDELRLTGDVTLTAALPEITSDVSLEGGDFTVARDGAAPDFGIFSVTAGSFALRNTTVANGRATNGGAIRASDRPVSISGSTLTGNEAISGGGAIFVEDYGGLVSVVDSTLDGNSAVKGGAIYAGFGGRSIVSNSTLSGNSATRGGAIYSTDYADVRLTNSTVSGNSASSRGGGVYTVVYGHVDLVNSTVSGNGNWNLYAGFKAFINSIYVDRTIVAYPNGGGNCSTYGGAYIVGGQYNYDDDASCPYASPITPGVDFDTTLADNGGPTLTHALLEGSVAADAAGDCGLGTDQRGFARDDGACDSGSFELGASPPFALSLAGSCPGTITLDVTAAPGADVQLFAGPGPGTSFVPSGRCAGTELDLLLARKWRAITTDENGEASLTRTVTSNWCGRHLQALDRSCATSNVVAFPE